VFSYERGTPVESSGVRGLYAWWFTGFEFRIFEIRMHGGSPVSNSGFEFRISVSNSGFWAWVQGPPVEPRCRANMAQIRQSRPDSGLGFQV
jgi:hypothetical protein